MVSTDKAVKIGCSAFIFAIVCVFFGSMAYVISETSKENDPISSPSTTCGSFPQNISYIKAVKDITALTHWTYDININGNAGSMVMRCPTLLQHDLDVYYNGVAVGRTNTKILSLLSEVDLLDCHNNNLYTVKTANVESTLINMNGIYVSVLVNKGGQVMYYVKSTSFFTTSIDLYDSNNTLVANLYLDKFKDLVNLQSWTWNITVYDPLTKPVDPLLLVAIAGKRSFSETDSNGNAKYDWCNSLFYDMWIVMFVFMALVIVAIMAGIYYAYKNQICCKKIY